jgi:hypothetical protein
MVLVVSPASVRAQAGLLFLCCGSVLRIGHGSELYQYTPIPNNAPHKKLIGKTLFLMSFEM